MTDRSGPTLPPTPLIVWHFRHWASLLTLARISRSPRLTLPLRASRARRPGRFFGSSLPFGAGNAISALLRRSGYGLLRSSRARSGVRSPASFFAPCAWSSQVVPGRLAGHDLAAGGAHRE